MFPAHTLKTNFVNSAIVWTGHFSFVRLRIWNYTVSFFQERLKKLDQSTSPKIGQSHSPQSLPLSGQPQSSWKTQCNKSCERWMILLSCGWPCDFCDCTVFWKYQRLHTMQLSIFVKGDLLFFTETYIRFVLFHKSICFIPQSDRYSSMAVKFALRTVQKKCSCILWEHLSNDEIYTEL